MFPRHAVYLSDLESADAHKDGRVPPSEPQSTTHESANEISVMDTETEKWLIPTKHKDELESMKLSFTASSGSHTEITLSWSPETSTKP
jgi:hypothetical protein